MENRIRLLLLVAIATLSGCSTFFGRNAPPAEEPVIAEAEPAVVIEPQVERRKIRQARIDSENWEAGLYVGSLSVEDFEVNIVTGARFAYHINEDFFAEGIVARSDAGLSSYERLSGSALLLSDSERKVTYYSLGFGWNVLPGEVFVGGRRALNSAVYLTAGAGGTQFAGGDRFTVTIGAGARVLIKDWLAAHIDVRDHVFEIDVVGTNKTSHNLEATLSITAFF